jgi:hypothetical protein
MITNTVVGTAKYSLPAGYTVESAFARISSVNGGFEWHLAMTAGANPPGVTNQFQIGKIKAGKLNLEEIRQEPAGTKYRIEPVMIIKDANGNTFVVSGPAIEIEAK